MQTTEAIMALAWRIAEDMKNVQAATNRLADMPVYSITDPTSVRRELAASGVTGNDAERYAKVLDQQIGEARDALLRALAEMEIVHSMADDMIGKSGRLF